MGIKNFQQKGCTRPGRTERSGIEEGRGENRDKIGVRVLYGSEKSEALKTRERKEKDLNKRGLKLYGLRQSVYSRVDLR